MEKKRNYRSAPSNLGEELSELPGLLPDISDLKRPMLMMVHFKNESSSILETFFEVLSLNLEPKTFKRISIIIFRHDEKGETPEKTFYAIGFEPPKEMTRKTMALRCVDALRECGKGELLKFFRIEDNYHWQEQLETEFEELAEPDWVLSWATLTV